jgi:cytochrome oxidase Cu insertion factor (SCO1/SenC/PrrC family)
MKFRFAFLLAIALSLAPLAPVAIGAQEPTKIAITNLKVGEVAPNFTLLDDQWHPVTLSQYRGKTVVLAFYVLAFTEG